MKKKLIPDATTFEPSVVEQNLRHIWNRRRLEHAMVWLWKKKENYTKIEKTLKIVKKNRRLPGTGSVLSKWGHGERI